MTILTLKNAAIRLQDDNAICLNYIYSWRSAKYWRLEKPVKVLLSTETVLTIPAGFDTDISSVPRPFWPLCPPVGDFALAALIHDYLYVHNVGTRAQADREMLVWSNAINKNRLDNWTRWAAVRLFGWIVWNKAKRRIKKEKAGSATTLPA